MITVVGATGKVGAEIVQLLRSRGAPVRAVSRDERRLTPAIAMGAVGCVADLRRPETLPAALERTRVLILTANAFLGRGANDLQRVDVAGQAALVDSARNAGVERVVFVSASGADAHHPVDLFRAKASTEARLQESGIGTVVLRAAPFMETWLGPVVAQVLQGAITTLVGQGVNPIPFVARGDVARVAVEAALAPSGPRLRRIAVGGPERISFRAAVELAGQLTGRASTIRRRSPSWARVSYCMLRWTDPVRARLLRTAVWLEETDHPPTPAEVPSTYGPFVSALAFLQSKLRASA